MAKKFFVLFVATCFVWCAEVANAGDWTKNINESNATYEITYDLRGVDDAEIEESTITEDIVGGSNFQAIYTLPKLEFNVDYEYDDTEDQFDADGEFLLSGDKISYKWRVEGPFSDGQRLSTSKLIYNLNEDRNILAISGILPEEYGKTITYNVVATLESFVTSGLVVKEQNEDEDEQLTQRQLEALNKTILDTVSQYASGTSFDQEITFTIDEQDENAPQYTYIEKNSATFSDYVEAAAGIDLNSVADNYSVTIKVPFETTTDRWDDTLITYTYKNFVVPDSDSEEGALSPAIEIPSWLKVENVQVGKNGDDDDENIISFEIKANQDSYAIKETEGVVRFALLDQETNETNQYVQWDVTCNMESSALPSTPDTPNPQPGGDGDNENFSIIGDGEVTIYLTQNQSSNTATITYKGTIDQDRTQKGGHMQALITNNLLEIDYSQNGTVILTAKAPSNINTEFTGTLTFYGVDGASATAKVTIVITDSETLALSSNLGSNNSTTINAGSSGNVIITAAGGGGAVIAAAGLLTWSVKKNDEGLEVNKISETNNSATYTITPSSSASGRRSFTITATYGSQSLDIDLIVTVTNSSGGGGDNPDSSSNFTLTPTPSVFTVVKGGNSQRVNVTVDGSYSTPLTWDIDQVQGLSTQISNGVATIAAYNTAVEGPYSVRITATDSAGTSAVTNITVTVSGVALSDAEKYEELIEKNAENIRKIFSEASNLGVYALDSGARLDSKIEKSDEAYPDYVACLLDLTPPEVPAVGLNGVNGAEIPYEQIYVFPVSYDLIQAVINDRLLSSGDKIFVHVWADPDPNDEDSDSEKYDAYLVDDDGKRITTVPVNGNNGINVAARLETLEANQNYWPVISNLFTITPSITNMRLSAGRNQNFTFTANRDVASWDVSPDAGLNVGTPTLVNNNARRMRVSITADDDLDDGDYEFTVTAYNIDGVVGTKVEQTFTLKVTANYEIKLSATPSTLTLRAGGDSQTVTVTASGKTSGDLRWTIQDRDGLSVRIEDEDEDASTAADSNTESRQYRISAPSGATTGNHTVVIALSDDLNLGIVSIDVTVTAANSNNNNNNNNGGNTTPTLTDEEKRLNFIYTNSAIAQSALHEISDAILSFGNFVSRLAQLASSAEDEAIALDVGYFASESRNAIDVKENVDTEAQVVVLALPTLNKDAITEPAVYVFVIDIASKIQEALDATALSPDSALYVHATPLDSDSEAESDSESEEAELETGDIVSLSNATSTKGMFLDDSGNELPNVSKLLDAIANGSNINVAAYLDKTDSDYSFVITTDAEDEYQLGASGAGCTGGSLLGLFATAFASSVFLIRKRLKKVTPPHE